jgi:polysaccharide export outer membrane protein
MFIALPSYIDRLGTASAIAMNLLLAGSIGVTSAQQQPAEATSAAKTSTDSTPNVVSPDRTPDERYRIGPGDVLDIRVFNRPQLSRETVRIDGHGMIRMPLVEGEIRAACLTETELAHEIAARYRKYLKDPQIDVFVKEFQSQPVAVIGAVNTPGQFKLQRQVRLLELLTFANGPADRAGRTIQIIHMGGPSLCEKTTDDFASSSFVSYKLSDTLQGEDRGNPYVRPGDVISIPDADQIYVVGNVVQPRAIPLKEPITVSRAIAMAGGEQRDSKRDRVKIVRQQPGSTAKQEIYVDLKAIEKHQAEDVALFPNDIVDVPISTGKSLLRTLVGTIVPTVSQLPMRVIP